ncbi:caspase family protein [Pseudanabaena sp. 'Roaring Creek']|uniref:caspase family protein n=1 Tax=Pseudanabaena sp. 'Roaring Creek' TaxID=1681830 RepID=UPI0006D83615|nr:caspase family protein [Pseudanabaena sp. 'Roaring Creek']
MSPVKRLVSLSIATGLAIFTVVGFRTTSQQAVLAQNAALPQQHQLIAQKQKQSRIALVIGNAAYDEGALANPVNDATDIAKALEELGFEVTLRSNLNKREMDEEIAGFRQKLRNGGVGVFYYAGHGVQVEKENYLIPLNVKLLNETDTKYDAVPLGKVLDAMEAAETSWNVVIIDACRDNPFYRRWYRSINTRGLTAVTPPNGIIIAYATKSGNVAADGIGKRNSPFTSALLENIKRANLDVRLLFGEVTELVAQKTSKKQVPWTEGNLIGSRFYLNSTSDNTTSPIPVNSPIPKPIAVPPRTIPDSTKVTNEKIEGNFKIKLLDCKASGDRVLCNLSIENITSIDRTLYVASKQHGGIRSTGLDGLGVTTMIDANGASYVADTISFANKRGDETGQSYFTVYGNTHPTLKFTFTGVENPIQRFDLLIGEHKKSENSIEGYRIRYSANSDGSFTLVP